MGESWPFLSWEHFFFGEIVVLAMSVLAGIAGVMLAQVVAQWRGKTGVELAAYGFLAFFSIPICAVGGSVAWILLCWLRYLLHSRMELNFSLFIYIYIYIYIIYISCAARQVGKDQNSMCREDVEELHVFPQFSRAKQRIHSVRESDRERV